MRTISKCILCNGDISEYYRGIDTCAWCDEGVDIEFDMCEHGLSAWLCMGPNHYPTDEQEMRGELYP